MGTPARADGSTSTTRHRRRGLFAAAVGLVLAAALAGPSYAQFGTIVLRGQLPLAMSPNVNSDVWGWVDPATNREYAIVGEFRGNAVRIVDVSDPENPVLTATIATAIGQDVKTWQNYLYLVDGDGSTIDDGEVYDISDPANPVFVGNIQSGHNITIDENGYLYKSVNGIKIYDLNVSPTNRVPLWSDGRSGGHDATVAGNRLYDSHGSSTTFIYDVTDPANPIELGSIPLLVGIAYHHNSAVSADGNYLYITDELSNSTRPDITVWDISDPANIDRSPVGQYLDPNATVHNVLRVGNLLLSSFYVAGFRVFDVSDPSSVVLLDEYDTSAFTGDGQFDGAWGCYPFAPSGNVYVSDMQNGLFIFTVEGLVSVYIAAFDAVYANRAVKLTWAIGRADGLRGFNIYRAAGAGSDFERLNARLLGAGDRFEYVDDAVEPGASYTYRLGAVDRDGEAFSPTETVEIPSIGLSLLQNYPNPFNPVTTITYELPVAAPTRLAVYDARGRAVRTLVSGLEPAGRRAIAWDGRDDAGAAVASGTYFYRLESAGRILARSMILLK